MSVINTIGRRKSSVARIYVSEGTGQVTVNKKILKFISQQEFYNTKLTNHLP